MKNTSYIKKIREEQNMTQQELAVASGISVRTLQRIEAGTEPKGYTLKALANALQKKEIELVHPNKEILDYPLLKIINISSLPFTILPPLNIIIPIIIMLAKKDFSPKIKQVISLQFMLTIFSAILFILASVIKNKMFLSNTFILMVMLLLVLVNVTVILINAASIDKKGILRIRLNFSIF